MAGSKASRRKFSPRQVAKMKAVYEMLVKADITPIVSGRVFSDNFLWDLLPSVADNCATILVKAKGDPASLFGLEKIFASFHSRVKVLKPSPLSALGEADGEEEKVEMRETRTRQEMQETGREMRATRTRKRTGSRSCG